MVELFWKLNLFQLTLIIYSQALILGIAADEDRTMSYYSIDTTKMFYLPSEDPWDLVDYKNQLKAIEESEKWITGLKVMGMLPEVPVAFKGLSGFMSLLVSVTTDKTAAFWHTITAEIDKRILQEKMSTMNAKIEGFKSSFEHVEHQNVDFLVAGFRQIDDIMAHFTEPSSILKKYPLHSSPALLGFVPVLVLYVQYAAKRFPDEEVDWRSDIYNKAMWNLEVFKELCIRARIDAASSIRWYDVYYNQHVHPFDNEGTFPLKNFLDQSRANRKNIDFDPNKVRCSWLGNKDCRGKAEEFWKHSNYAKQCWDKHRYECIVDRFSNQVVLAESAYDGNLSGQIFGKYMNDWNEQQRVNCLLDYIRVIEYLYQTTFWRVGSLIY